MAASFRFDRFVLDPADRQLRRDDTPVELNARYLDALALLVREQGKLVSKDRFLDEVWRGVPVTDEALTQCIRTLRRQLGDDAARPAFIETVPKHGYRFIAPVETLDGDRAAATAPRDASNRWREFLVLAGAGTVGGGLAGLLGGLFYGLASASEPLGPGMGALSVLLVVLSLCILVALLGAAGVSFGIAAARLARADGWQWTIAGGALGGLFVGAFVKLIGLDTFNLLFGRAPGDITGGAEGALLGAAVGLGASLAGHGDYSPRRSAGIGALAGGAAGLAIALFGGRLMGGSLVLIASDFPGSNLRLNQVGALVGESGFGPTSHLLTGALEGALFSAGIVAALVYARRGFANAG
jgi:DNA-binding winged helix-turn-helix (wHTH) protein